LFAALGLTLLVGILVCARFVGDVHAQIGAPPKAGKGGKGKNDKKDKDGQAADRAALAKAARSFADAFERGDAKALAAHFTDGGEFISDDGTTLRGRAAIEKDYAEQFAKRKKDAKVAVEIEVDGIRFPSRDTAIEEGHFRLREGKDAPTTSKYSILHVREGGQWLMAVVREWPAQGASLRDLDWLIGTWSAQRDDTEVATTYEWWGGKNFIRVQFTIKTEGKTITGFQMIGKDASTGQLRSWSFDPDGSFGEAAWSRDGKKWMQDSAAVLADGTTVSATHIITRLDNDAFSFQSVERTVGDEKAPDIGPIRVTRVKKAVQP
jgi:uncharacterized protein (TIGR02246 family)